MGQSPPSHTYNQDNVGLPFFQGKAKFTDLYPRIEKYCAEPKKLASKGATLLSVRARVGPTNLAKIDCCIGRGLAGIHPLGGIEPKFILFLIRSIEHYLSSQGTGSTFTAINKDFLNELAFALPPANEQRRIVAKIEELLSELDKAIESLKEAKEQIKVYRQAVLSHAFQGKLTEQWREENKNKIESTDELLKTIKRERETKYEQRLEEWKVAVEKWEAVGKPGKKPSRPRAPKPLARLINDELAELPPLPDGWLWDRLGWMTCGVEYGTAAKSKESGKVPVLRMGNIQNAKFDFTDLVFTSDEEEIAKYSLHDGDVLFNRTNSPELVGKTAIYRGEQPALFAGYLIRVNQIESVVDAQYLNLFLNSHTAKQQGNKVKTDGVNQSNINGEKLQNYPFPFCSIAEQHEIVRILEQIMPNIDSMETDVDLELRRVEVLRLSILNKAFSGKLVAQDPSDEPASALLEQIREGKSKVQGKKIIKKRKSAA